MKIRVQQLNPTIGDIKGNTSAILDALADAEAARIDLLLLPELVVCGYSPMDLLERPAFREAIYEANMYIADCTQKTAVLFGTITPNHKKTGRKCFNSALFAHGGEVKTEIHKTLLPTYSVYDELRYFEPNKTFGCIEFKGRKIGAAICEDIWCNFGEGQKVIYEVNPVEELANSGAEAIFNLSASPYDKNKPTARVQMLREQIEKVKLPVFYANQVGGNNDLISDGDSMVLNNEGSIVARGPLFEEAFIDVEWNSKNELIKTGETSTKIPSQNEQILRALVLGLRDYLRKANAGGKVILGLSGGIDSALVACIAAEALGAENVSAVAMPSEFSSKESVSDAEELADNLGIKLHQFSIKSVYEQYLKTLESLFRDTPFGTAEENLQARARGMLLMALSNKFGGLVLNTGNKSESAVGYCTLYGDMAGALAVISDLYKTEVYELANWLNEIYYEREIIPQTIIQKLPSAELRPGQKDSDSLPEYNILDAVLKLYIEHNKSVAEITAQGYEQEMVSEIVSRIHQNEYKRWQAPPGLKISGTAFGAGLRWPVTGNINISNKE